MKVDHFASLLRAVASLEHTSYEARGAIYDRAQCDLMERLEAAVPACSEADIDRELLAFRRRSGASSRRYVRGGAQGATRSRSGRGQLRRHSDLLGGFMDAVRIAR